MRDYGLCQAWCHDLGHTRGHRPIHELFNLHSSLCSLAKDLRIRKLRGLRREYGHYGPVTKPSMATLRPRKSIARLHKHYCSLAA
jgi:hypothetical protein